MLGAGVYKMEFAPLPPLKLAQMSDAEIRAIVKQEVPLGSTPPQVKSWIERHALKIVDSEGRVDERPVDQDSTVGHITTLSVKRETRTGWLTFLFDGAQLQRFYIHYPVA